MGAHPADHRLLSGGRTAGVRLYVFLRDADVSASASIYIVSASNNSIVNLTDLQIGSQLTADYQELMLSRPLLQDVIKIWTSTPATAALQDRSASPTPMTPASSK